MSEHGTNERRRQRRRDIDREGAQRALRALEDAMRRGGYTLGEDELSCKVRKSAA